MQITEIDKKKQPKIHHHKRIKYEIHKIVANTSITKVENSVHQKKSARGVWLARAGGWQPKQ